MGGYNYASGPVADWSELTCPNTSFIRRSPSVTALPQMVPTT